jgi:hypothetical protein
VADLDEALARADLEGLPLVLDARLEGEPEGFLLHAGEEGLRHPQLDVGLEQAETHLA